MGDVQRREKSSSVEIPQGLKAGRETDRIRQGPEKRPGSQGSDGWDDLLEFRESLKV